MIVDYKLHLLAGGEVSCRFLKANSALLNKLQINNTNDLIQAWKKEYDIDLILPDRLKFHNETDLTMFLIRWS
jgi:hypothetical protein